MAKSCAALLRHGTKPPSTTWILTPTNFMTFATSYISKIDGKEYFGLVAEDVAKVIPDLAEYARAKDVIPGSTSDELIPDAVKYPMLSVLLLEELKKEHASRRARKNQCEPRTSSQSVRSFNRDLNDPLIIPGITSGACLCLPLGVTETRLSAGKYFFYGLMYPSKNNRQD